MTGSNWLQYDVNGNTYIGSVMGIDYGNYVHSWFKLPRGRGIPD